jgi:hypothetical protein
MDLCNACKLHEVAANTRTQVIDACGAHGVKSCRLPPSSGWRAGHFHAASVAPQRFGAISELWTRPQARDGKFHGRIHRLD